MDDRARDKKECFGVLEVVFPIGEDGLRHSPDACMTCADKTECLRTAVAQADGLRVKEESVDRAYQARRISFLQRWSRKKSIDRQRRQSKCNK